MQQITAAHLFIIKKVITNGLDVLFTTFEFTVDCRKRQCHGDVSTPSNPQINGRTHDPVTPRKWVQP